MIFAFSILLLLLFQNPAQAEDGLKRFTILHTNDEHSHLLPFPLGNHHSAEIECGKMTARTHEQPGNDECDAQGARGGMARLAALADNIRSERARIGQEVVMVSAGDFMGGSPFGWLVVEDRAVELQLMQKAGYDVITPGNHEFDYGPEVFASYLKAAGYPGATDRTVIVASNTHPPDGHPLGDRGLQSYHLHRLENGLTLGFLGLLGDNAQGNAPFTDPVSFSDPVSRATDIADTLRALGADVVIAVTHSGVKEDSLLALKVPEIDLIVGGHSHNALHRPLMVDDTPIVQAGYYLRYLGQIDLGYDTESGRLVVLNEESDTPFLHPLDHHIAKDSTMEGLVAAWSDTLNRKLADWSGDHFPDIRTRIARSRFDLERKPPLKEHALGNFVTDAMRLETSRVLEKRIDAAFQANGALRADLHRSEHPAHEDKILFYDAVSAVGLGAGNRYGRIVA